MGRWIKPRIIASKGIWYLDTVYDYEGPACYELGLFGPRGGNARWMYVGETNNEKRRIQSYAKNGSHVSELIEAELETGWHLYYQSHRFSTKELAKRRQDQLLGTYNYPWNKLLNGNRW